MFYAMNDQTITFGALADKTYGDAAFTVSGTATSGLTVYFSSLTRKRLHPARASRSGARGSRRDGLFRPGQ